MTHRLKTGLAMAMAVCLVSGGAMAQREREGGSQGPRAEARQVEPHPGPRGYSRVTEPPGWNARPSVADRGVYQHNFQAARPYQIGPYRRPSGWVNRRWAYGDILPPAYWAAPYVLADYWLFGLEIPPIGYEWVRVGADAVLVSTMNGEVLQVVYGTFF
ncbi:MAG: RcnB family protein [Rhodoferax sp.]|nr:RcnB family protein [Rhodoferax sp.]